MHTGAGVLEIDGSTDQDYSKGAFPGRNPLPSGETSECLCVEVLYARRANAGTCSSRYEFSFTARDTARYQPLPGRS